MQILNDNVGILYMIKMKKIKINFTWERICLLTK